MKKLLFLGLFVPFLLFAQHNGPYPVTGGGGGSAGTVSSNGFVATFNPLYITNNTSHGFWITNTDSGSVVNVQSNGFVSFYSGIGTNALSLAGSDAAVNGSYNWGASGYIQEPGYTENAFIFNATPIPHWEIYDVGENFTDQSQPFFTNNSATVTAVYSVSQTAIDNGFTVAPTVSLAAPEPVIINPSTVTSFLLQPDAIAFPNRMKIYAVSSGPALYLVDKINNNISFIVQNDDGNRGFVNLVAANSVLNADVGMEFGATNFLFYSGNLNVQAGFIFAGSGGGITNITQVPNRTFPTNTIYATTNTAPFNLSGAGFITTGGSNVMNSVGHHLIHLGGQYTNTLASTAYMWLTNLTTHDCAHIGLQGGAVSIACTNPFDIYLPASAGDLVVLTNKFTAGANLGVSIDKNFDYSW